MATDTELQPTGAAVVDAGEQPLAPQTTEAATGAVTAPEPSREEVEATILADENLPPEDYAKARNEPEYMQALVDAYLEEKKQEKPAGEVAEEPKAEPADEFTGIEEPKRKAARGYKRKAERLEAKALDLEAELEETRRRAAELEAKLAQPAGAEPAKSVAAAEKPKPESFTTTEDYLDALTTWKADERVRLAFEAQHQAQEQRAQAELQRRAKTALESAWNTGMEKAREAHDDFEDVVVGSRLPINDAMQSAMARTGQAGEVAYWLAKHPKEAVAIHAMDAPGIYLEIGIIAARLNGTAPAAQPKPNVSNAPPPLKPLGGGTAKTVKDYAYYASDQCSGAEYAEARAKGLLR